jgi:ubiquinol-cytochrome c reductase iron-sulfur subunit
VSRLKRWVIAAGVLLVGRKRRRPFVPEPERLVEPGDPDPRAEWLVLILLLGAACAAAGFIAVYSFNHLEHQTQYLGLAIGLSFALLGAALAVVAKRLVDDEEHEEEYSPPRHPEAEEEIAQLVSESVDRFTRKRLLVAGAATAVGALGAALVVPALSLGPFLDTDPLYRTPWRRGRRLVDEAGKPYLLDEIEPETFYTAYADGASKEVLGSPLVVVRFKPSELHLPSSRHDWAPGGVVAYSKICTHAGCAVALFRKPTFRPVEPGPALVCPCHYSTFDPTRGGNVIFGPAGRPLPQLPLYVDQSGQLRAAGNFSGPVGPSWWGVRTRKPSTGRET